MEGPANLLEYDAQTRYTAENLDDILRVSVYRAAIRRAGAARRIYTSHDENIDPGLLQEFRDADNEVQAAISRCVEASEDYDTLTGREIRERFVQMASQAVVRGVREEAASVEPTRPPGIFRRAAAAVGRAMSSRTGKAVLYTAAGVGVVVGVLSGAWIPMGIAAAVGGTTSPIVARGVRRHQGRSEASAARNARYNTPEGIQDYTNALLAAIALPRLGEGYGSFEMRIRQTMLGRAANASQGNYREKVALSERRMAEGSVRRDI